MEQLTYRLKTRADIRRNAKGRKSVEEGKPDRIADLLEEAALKIEHLETTTEKLKDALISLVQESNVNDLRGMQRYLQDVTSLSNNDDAERSLFAINILIEVLEEESSENS